MAIEERIEELKQIAYHPAEQLKAYKAAGKKVICCMPYYVPEELVYALDMAPMGLWGTNTKTVLRAKEYCASFYCSLAQLCLEMMLDGTLDEVDGVITPTMCDTLRPMSQNIKTVIGERAIFLAHPQNRFKEYGIKFCMHQYRDVQEQLERIAGKKTDNEALLNAIKVYNASRGERRRFVKLAAAHPEAVSAVHRSAVLKASYFMPKNVYTEKLKALNDELEALPASTYRGIPVMTSGIICDNPNLLRLFDENHLYIVADDVGHESRGFRIDAPEDDPDGMHALAVQFSKQNYDSILYDCDPNGHERARHMIRLAKQSGAEGIIMFITQFCDPEETDYPYIKRDTEIAGYRLLHIVLDMQQREFGQVATSLQGFAAMLEA